MLCLPEREDVPMVAMISRLVAHKGLDLVKRVFEDMLKNGVQFAILGSGEPEFRRTFVR